MKRERMLQILHGAHVSEKSALISQHHGQHVFRVARDASRDEVRQAIETLFDVKVLKVGILNVKGKRQRAKFGVGRRAHWKKAYVRLDVNRQLDMADAKV